MTVSLRLILVDSVWERIIEDKFWRERRRFTKPRCYDSEAEVFPDFLPRDVTGQAAVPLEVFGMTTPEYLACKVLKVAHYQEEYGGGFWWSWDAFQPRAAEKIPPFPARRSSGKSDPDSGL
ncbi:DUF1173 family protein [Pantoea osteomyelitidis]|uniref:DUF1173 family protein n=2 Tax=Pantoea osteomyelitidis TaxID=3230026 RepID=A0ABW7Q200_9GAMM